MPITTADPASRNRRCQLARKAAGLNVSEAAEKLGKGESTIRSWETNGGPGPKSHEDLIRMCQLYGITTDWYLEGREPIYRSNTQLSPYTERLLELLPLLTNEQLENLLCLIESFIR